jgi:diguanylate cyclase (GGDEF)-like protein/PAS domain S-box-containing protein
MSMHTFKSLLQTSITIILLAALYFMAGKAGLTFASLNASVTVIWPPTGIALAALLLFGYRVWPGVFLAAFLVNITTTDALWTSLGIASGNTLEALIGAYLTHRYANDRHAFDRARDIVKFAVLAGMVSTALSATVGVTSLSLAGYAKWSDYGFVWLTWWLGDAGGALLVTPLLVLWWLTPRVEWTRHQTFEAMFLLLMLIAVGQIVFGGWLPDAALNYPVAYLFVPLLAWSAYRFGPRETATVSLLMAGIAVWGTLHGFGPFVGKTPNESLALLQSFMVVTAVMALILAVIVQERQRATAGQAQLAAIVESSDDAIIGKTVDGTIVNWNVAAERIFGYRAAEVLGKSITILLPEDRLGEEPRLLERLKYGERIQHFETIRRRKDGSMIDVSLTTSPIKDPRGTTLGVSTIVRDISDRKQAEKILERTNEELAARVRALEQQSNQIMLLSQLGEMLQASRTLEEVYTIINSFAPRLFRNEAGFLGILSSPSNLIETVVTWHDPLAGKTDFRIEECWALRRARLYTVGESHAGPYCRHLDRPFPASCLCVPIMAEGETLGLLHVQGASHPVQQASSSKDLLDASTQRMALAMAQQIALAIANLKLRSVLRSQAMRDPLTGLFNRRYLTELLELELRRAQRDHQSVGIVMLDIDHFKRVNDTFGHLAGDTVLREIAEMLKKKCRSADILSRYGGEEFMLIMPSASLEYAMRRADALRDAVGSLQLAFETRPLGQITVSLGVAVFPDHGPTSEALIQAADAALYRAKQGGRNQVIAA